MRTILASLTAVGTALIGAVGGPAPVDPAPRAADMVFAVSVSNQTQPPEPTDKESPHVWQNTAHDRLFYVTALVNGHPIRFVVDTGSSIVVLTPDDARKAGVEVLSGSPMQVTTAGGASSMKMANLQQVRIADQTIPDVDGAIVSANMRVSLLGQSVLSRLHSVRIAGDRLELN